MDPFTIVMLATALVSVGVEIYGVIDANDKAEEAKNRQDKAIKDGKVRQGWQENVHKAQLVKQLSIAQAEANSVQLRETDYADREQRKAEEIRVRTGLVEHANYNVSRPVRSYGTTV